MYKFDTHVHTSETSPCGHVSAQKTIKLYKKLGFNGVYITDHYNENYFSKWGCNSWEKTIDKFLKGYRNAKAYGDKNDFDVLLGMELLLKESSPNEYLLYGFTEEFLYSNEALYDYSMDDIRKLAKENNIWIFQAHPFRVGLTRETPKYLDGVEAFNGNARHNSHNDLALLFAKENNLHFCSGSDCHEICDVGTGGIETDVRIKDFGMFKEVLIGNKYKMIKNM